MTQYTPRGAKPQWAMMAEFAASQPPDAIIMKAELAASAGTLEDRVSGLVVLANHHLQGDGIRLVSVGGGYRVATPDEMLYEATVARVRRAYKQLTRGSEAAVATINSPVSTHEDRKKAADAQVLLDEQRRATSRIQRRMSRYRPEMPVVSAKDAASDPPE